MSLPFFLLEILVNSAAICWWWPHFLGSASSLQIKSGQTSFTKYIKLSWHNLMCSIHFFSTANLNCSFVSNSLFIWVPFLIYTHNINNASVSISQSLKHESRYNHDKPTWEQYLVVKFEFRTRFGTSMS